MKKELSIQREAVNDYSDKYHLLEFKKAWLDTA